VSHATNQPEIFTGWFLITSFQPKKKAGEHICPTSLLISTVEHPASFT
jgi:hypothetical protein